MNDSGKLPSAASLMIDPSIDDICMDDEDISKHQGRIRSFPHERGIWASCIFIHYGDIDGFCEIQSECKRMLDTSTAIDFRPIENLHLSISKTFTIRHHNIAPFVDNLQEQFAVYRPFRLQFNGLHVYVNDERSRTFIGVRVDEASCGTLESLVTSLDECMQQYKLPQYYADRSYHVSILWCLGDKREAIRQHLSALTDVFNQIYEEEYSDMNPLIRKLCFKCGNKSFYFDLA